jgi:hypothetical protein
MPKKLESGLIVDSRALVDDPGDGGKLAVIGDPGQELGEGETVRIKCEDKDCNWDVVLPDVRTMALSRRAHNAETGHRRYRRVTIGTDGKEIRPE